ncbi:MAG: hypothetical protein IIB44_04455 [Candidatus Marinimicrobia bacterium]|nr:hypothetical protein [Candidatus Neomarinimicrobiota bacterium]
MSGQPVDKQRLEWLMFLADKNKGEIHLLPEEMYVAIGDPGPGSEKAYFFLGRYSYDNRWEGWGFCKTQYAEHFVESHVLLIEWLDVFRKSRVNIDVFDEGNYWETQDVTTLLGAYERFNTALDSFTGVLQKYEAKIEGAAPDYVKHRKNKLN